MGEAEWKHGLFGCRRNTLTGDIYCKWKIGKCKFPYDYENVFIIVIYENIMLLSNKINIELSHFRPLRMLLFPLFVVQECQ